MNKKNKEDFLLVIKHGHAFFRFHNFWNENQIISEFQKVISCLNSDIKIQQEVFSKFVIYILDYCESRQIDILDKICDERLFKIGRNNNNK